MPIYLIAIFLFLISLIPTHIFGQVQSAQSKTAEIVAQFNKTKHKIKEKGGFKFESYFEIRSEAVIKRPEEYSGIYSFDGDGAALEIRAEANGAVTGKGKDADGRTFSITNGRIEGALLIGTKTYENGDTDKFEGVFMKRNVKAGKSPTEISQTFSVYGFGVPGESISIEGNIYNGNIFYESNR